MTASQQNLYNAASRKPQAASRKPQAASRKPQAASRKPQAYPYELLTDYFTNANHIDTSQTYEIYTIPARELLTPERFDIMAKWLYIDALEKNSGIEQATEIYRDNINAFSGGTFIEPGTEEKNSFDRYMSDFHKLIADIKANGFNDGISLIPLGDDNIILDGSHRTAIAAYYNKSVTVIRIPGMRRLYDYKCFRQHLMSDTSTGLMAQAYTTVKQNMYMACLWPRTRLKFSEAAESIIREAGSIYYSQDVYLTFNGMKNFVANIYYPDSWTGSETNNFAGARNKARACFNKHYPVRTFLFQADSQERVIECKQKIRALYNIDKSSLHISDDQEETEMMCRILYTPEILRTLNFTQNYIYGRNYAVPDAALDETLPLRYRPSRIHDRLEWQKSHGRYGAGPISELGYRFRWLIVPTLSLYRLLRKIKHKIFGRAK